MSRGSMLRLIPAAVTAWIIALTGANSLRAETLDRIAVTVGRQVIAESDILLDLRVSAFLDGKAVDLSPAARRRSAGRLVDQILILQEAAESHVTLSVDEDLAKMLGQVKAQFGSEDAYQAALARYAITEKDVSAQLAAGIRTLRFSDFRFRPEVQIGDQELHAYYDQLAAGWRQKNPELVPTFESSRDQVEQLLIEQRITDSLDKWLAMTRNETRIVYREQVIP
jgi:hypothetical protein